MLFHENAIRKRFHRIAVFHRNGRLQQDGAAIQMFINEVHRTPRNFDSVRERLILRIQTWKRRKEGGMHVQNSFRKLPDKLTAEQPEITGETHQVNLMLLQ